jgi:hypothetical protein
MHQDEQIAAFLARYSEAIATQTALARDFLAGYFPRGYELVYDNYNALAFGFGPSERAGQVIVSIAAYPRWVTLFFLHGAQLPDPEGLLQGTGRRVRSVRLVPLSVLHSAPVEALLRAAIAPSEQALAAAPSLRSIVKSVSPSQRPRRAADAAS